MTLSEDDISRLTTAALQAQQRAYAPYSQFAVGAAILSASGAIILGCNVENASYGLAMCAERCAIGTMVARGESKLRAIAIASVGAVTPCGACRQVLAEFGMDYPVYLIDSQTHERCEWSMEDLLPGAFRLS